MNATNNTDLIIAFVGVVGLFLHFDGGAMTGGTLNGSMMGSGMVGGIS